MSNDKLIEEVDAYIYKYGSERWAGNVTSSDFEAKRIINLVQADMKAKCLEDIKKELQGKPYSDWEDGYEAGIKTSLKIIEDIK